VEERGTKIDCATLLVQMMWRTVLLEKVSFSWSRNSPPFMETEGSLLFSQELNTAPYPEPVASNAYVTTLFP